MSEMATPQLRRLSVADFHRMADAGIFTPGERVELLDGMLVRVSRAGRPHGAVVAAIVAHLFASLSSRASIVDQASLALGPWNEPQPDVAVLSPTTLRDLTRLVEPHEIFALVEVAESSLRRDTGSKCHTYASCGIPGYVVSDLTNNVLLHFARPQDGRYGEQRRLSYGDTFVLAAFPDLELAADPFLLPRAATPT
jgi:hypothetical protein